MKLPFNDWSKSRIKQGRKFCTSRTKKYDDKQVTDIWQVTLRFVKQYLWQVEGADSPEEFEEVWNSIHPKKKFNPEQMVYVHFGNFAPKEK